jgi:hypothetical protein
MNTIKLTLPYSKRDLRFEIKERGGRFNAETKDWTLEDTNENRELVQLIQRPVTGPTPKERIGNIANTCAELLNALKIRNYRVAEIGDRIVLESDPLPNPMVNRPLAQPEIR